MTKAMAGSIYNAALRLADHEGLEILATDEAIAFEANLPVGSIRPALDHLADSGHLRILGPDDDLDRRTLVVMAHPRAESHTRMVLFGFRGSRDPLAWIPATSLGWLKAGVPAAEVVGHVEARLLADGSGNRRRDRGMVSVREIVEAWNQRGVRS